jgi:hypothetical protein
MPSRSSNRQSPTFAVVFFAGVHPPVCCDRRPAMVPRRQFVA